MKEFGELLRSLLCLVQNHGELLRFPKGEFRILARPVSFMGIRELSRY